MAKLRKAQGEKNKNTLSAVNTTEMLKPLSIYQVKKQESEKHFQLKSGPRTKIKNLTKKRTDPQLPRTFD